MSTVELDMILRGGSASRVLVTLVVYAGCIMWVGMATGGKEPSVCVLSKSK